MTFYDSETAPDDILSVLKQDGSLAAPSGARGRVFGRLGVGVVAVATVTHASTAGAAVGKAAGYSVSPIAGVAVGSSLVKAMGAHPIIGFFASLAFGSGVLVGAHEVFAPSPARLPLVTDADRAARPASKPAKVHEPRSEGARAAPRGEATPPSAPTTDGLVPSRPQPTALAPAPELPEDPRTARLAEQQALLDQARAALRGGDGARALAIVAGHQTLYPKTEFAEEREAIQILALVMLGRSDEARSRADAFAKRFPTSLFLPSIRASLAPPGIGPDGREGGK